ncbi:hypothetical protein [Blastococcus sp. SYSU D00820]
MLALVTVVLVGAVVVYLWYRSGQDQQPASDTSAAQPTGGASTTAPATAGEPEASGGAAAPTDEPLPPTAVPTTAPLPASPAPVSVLMSYSGWDAPASAVVAGGFVPDLLESDGTCTLTLTRDGVVLSGGSEATPDASTTSCGEVRVSGAELTSGPWQATLSYASPRSAGESQPFTVVVP